MATLAEPFAARAPRDRFFLITSMCMALAVIAGFSLQLGAGRSSFGAPAIVHVHAIVFIGWLAIYVLQNVLAKRRSMKLHRRLGWLAAGWAIAMVVLGTLVTVRLVRAGHAPFFFPPLKFLALDMISVLTFAGLTAAAIVYRKRTEWHSRLHYCGMAALLGPGIGRLMPLPLFIPYAFEATAVALLIFPLVAVIHDLRRRGSVHPGFVWGIGTILASLLLTEAVTYSPLGTALYRAVTAGSPGAAIDPLGYPAFPPMGLPARPG